MVYSFGPFELDTQTGELRKSGVRIKLSGQPRQVLTMLVEHEGALVTRQELKDALWKQGTFTDFEHGVHTAIERIRRALSDSARNPRFVETLPKRGYRFIAPLQTRAGASPPGERVLSIVESRGTTRIPRVAVLPLKTLSGDAETESFSEGLTQEITTGLSQFRHLAVVSSSAAARFRGQVGARQVGQELDARFLLEGTVRKSESAIRVSIQLVDASTEEQLWAERLERALGASGIFEMQDELTDRVVATVADSSGVLTRSLAALVKSKPVETLTADECVLLTFAYWEQVRPDLHAEVRTALERVLQDEPRHAEAWACLSRVYLDEYRFGFNILPNRLDRSLQAAREAVELDATSQNAFRSLAEAHYYRREFSAFRPAAERVLALNPRDTSNIGMTSQLIAYGLGDWARGRAVSEKAVKMNPHHAGWLNFMFAHDHFFKGEYEQALEFAERINMPGYNWNSGILAAIHGQLGNVRAARKHVETFVTLAPDYARNFQEEAVKWFPSQPFVDQLAEGLRKAGIYEALSRLDASVVARPRPALTQGG